MLQYNDNEHVVLRSCLLLCIQIVNNTSYTIFGDLCPLTTFPILSLGFYYPVLANLNQVCIEYNTAECEYFIRDGIHTGKHVNDLRMAIFIYKFDRNIYGVIQPSSIKHAFAVQCIIMSRSFIFTVNICSHLTVPCPAVFLYQYPCCILHQFDTIVWIGQICN